MELGESSDACRRCNIVQSNLLPGIVPGASRRQAHGASRTWHHACAGTVGVITDRDLCLRVLGKARDGAKTLVGDCMTANSPYCHTGDDAYLVLEMITSHGLRGMVVLNERGELEGVVSIAALANKLAAASKALCSALERLYDKEDSPETEAADKTDEFHDSWQSSQTQQ